MANRKHIGIKYNTRHKLKKCKSNDSERLAHVIERLLNKYEKEVMSYE